jgi:hypothetical protein
VPKSYLALAADGDTYAPVVERLALFWARFPTGRVVTELQSRSEREVTFRALLYRTPDEREPAATGWASEREGDGDVNAVACLENTETSAVGRALANLGFAARSGAGRVGASRPLIVREGVAAKVDDALQRRADAAMDALDLLGEAERAGLPLGKAAALRARLADPTIPLPLIERTERELRGWLAKRRAGHEGRKGD